MRKNRAAVLDVGSSRLQLMTGERGLNKTFLIKSRTEAFYDGFSQSAFFKTEDVVDAIHKVVAEGGIRGRIDELYVGVPGEFTESHGVYFNISLQKRKRITKEDIDKLYKAAYRPQSNRATLIAKSAVNYILSGNRRVSFPEGMVSDTLGGNLVFYLCDPRFIAVFDKELKAAGITKIHYYPQALAEVCYLFDQDEREKGGILVDVGYLTTTFSSFLGNAIVYGKSFSLGGGHIEAKLLRSCNFKISNFGAAQKLKRLINISYNPYSDARYEFEDGNVPYSVPVSVANEAAKAMLDQMAEQLSACIDEGIVRRDSVLEISLTGGGISYIRGAKEYLADRLGAIINVVAPKVPILGKPINSSVLSMMDLALKDIEKR